MAEARALSPGPSEGLGVAHNSTTSSKQLHSQKSGMEGPSTAEVLPPPSPKASRNASLQPSLSPRARSLRRKKALESNNCPWMVKRSKANRPRSTARSYQPARRSRGGSKGSWSSCSSTSSDRSAASEPKPEPSPSPSPDTENSERSPVRLRVVPGTKAERLAEYMKYWQRSGKLDEEEKSHGNETVKPKPRYNLRSTTLGIEAGGSVMEE